MVQKISDTVINRLTFYHSILADYEEKGMKYISSSKVANLLKIDDSQVRKDIKLLNNFGKCKVGYEVTALKKSIEEALNLKDSKKAFIVGAGNLGSAIAKYDRFQNYGLNIIALFDNDPIKVDMSINNKKVYHMSKLTELAKEHNVEIAILAVPRRQAQIASEFIVNAGIKYIWNFTHYIPDLPDSVQVWNENLIGNFLQFTVNHKKS